MVNNVLQWVSQLEQYLVVAVFGTGAAVTLVLVLFILGHGRRLEKACTTRTEEFQTLVPAAVEPATQLEAPVRYAQKAPEAAVQILAILQRQGRL